MKNIFFILLMASFSISTNAQTFKYFGVNNEEITESDFKSIRETRKYLTITGDSAHFKKLVHREEEGSVKHYNNFKSILQRHISKQLSETSLTVIIYYPGKDPCNTSGTATIKSMKNWYRELDKGVKKLTGTESVYICKNKDDMDNKRSPMLSWQNDPEHIIEKQFFKHHYPCESFVVIAPNGDYIAYFGEYSKEQVWNMVKRLGTKLKG